MNDLSTLQIIQQCQEKLLVLTAMINIPQLQTRLAEIDTAINDPAFWNDTRAAGVVMKERQKVNDLLEKLKVFGETVAFNNELAIECPEEIESIRVAAEETLQKMTTLEFEEMMSDPVDNTPAILTISAGAGGLESCNFVNMLLRMYCRWADQNGFNTEILDLQPSEEHSAICIDSVSIRVEGEYAFGYLKGESGVARLIRCSPFNSAGMRHTSFAAVSVVADIENEINIVIRDEDLEITAMRGSGSGGQAINKISSCIRCVHLPTGIVINSRGESSQHTNRRFAMKMLKAKLYEYEMKKLRAKEEKQLEQQSDVAFGHQIRTYTETPYSLVKDHRTGYEINNFDKVLDGDIQAFLVAYLRFNTGK
jgi:peptide chain release factor 2